VLVGRQGQSGIEDLADGHPTTLGESQTVRVRINVVEIERVDADVPFFVAE